MLSGRKPPMTNDKCIIQIPCYNEEGSLPVTLAALPRCLPGFKTVEWLVIDDGSTDRTAEVAKEHGVDHIVRLTHNQGLAKAFMAGISACLKLGADVIVNTDADNQYCAADIEKLVTPIVENRAEIVIGARPIAEIEHFSRSKRILQKIGSWVVRIFSKTDVADAPSGFRAFSRKAALRVNVFSDYTYTLEIIIQAGRNGMRILSVPIRINDYLRPSRLVKSSLSYVILSSLTILRIFVVYYPFKFFSIIGLMNFLAGFVLGVRYLVIMMLGGGGHVQSLILCAILIIIAFLMFTIAILADMMAVNRQLLEKIELHLKSTE